MGEDMYVVEKIVDVGIFDGIVKFKVRWKGYKADEDTWEPEENLESAPLALNKFFVTNPKKVARVRQSI
ncbi:unnamed protein product [Gongylonema pulchrum]|uniref:Chromo domain-containing protein n=1 Tax=Gongylonema pulchrum TaxID=637853 RepID=A0A183EV21_9BILA|nr:unnamed protein product [Gongylonema pulchrum]